MTWTSCRCTANLVWKARMWKVKSKEEMCFLFCSSEELANEFPIFLQSARAPLSFISCLLLVRFRYLPEEKLSIEQQTWAVKFESVSAHTEKWLELHRAAREVYRLPMKCKSDGELCFHFCSLEKLAGEVARGWNPVNVTVINYFALFNLAYSQHVEQNWSSSSKSNREIWIGFCLLREMTWTPVCLRET